MTRPYVNATSVTDTPSTMKRLTEYNTDGTAKYIGYAPMGSNIDDANAWTIHYFEYENQQEVSKTTAIGAWSNRAGLTYE